MNESAVWKTFLSFLSVNLTKSEAEGGIKTRNQNLKQDHPPGWQEPKYLNISGCGVCVFRVRAGTETWASPVATAKVHLLLAWQASSGIQAWAFLIRLTF